MDYGPFCRQKQPFCLYVTGYVTFSEVRCFMLSVESLNYVFSIT